MFKIKTDLNFGTLMNVIKQIITWTHCFLYDCLLIIRWYGTPCNILHNNYKDDRILINDDTNGFKNFKIDNIWPQNEQIKFHKRNKK